MFEYTFNIYLAILFSSLIIGIYYYKVLSIRIKSLLWLVAFSLLVEIIGWHFKVKWIYRFFQPIEYLIIAKYFFKVIQSSKIRKLINVTITLVVVLNMFNIFFYKEFKQLTTYCFLGGAFFLSVWSILYFKQCFKELYETDFAHNPEFWICTGILFFYAGSFFQMGFTNIIYSYNKELAQNLYVINHFLNYIFYVMLTYGFICQAKYQRLQQ